MVLQLALLTVLPLLAAFAAAMDLLTLTIPNRVCLALVAAFFALAACIPLSPAELASHLAAGLLLLAVGAGLFFRGWCGGGDAKLLAALGLWVGMPLLGAYALDVAIAGGALAAVFLTWRRVPLPKLLLAQPWLLRLYQPQAGIPYGIALAAGALVVYPQTVWFARAVL
jgi:prepilin peptidase CpaA